MFLRVRDLRSGYRRADVLQGVDIEVDRGRALALLGRNGAGKTTLVMTIMGLVRPNAGSVLLDGRELAGRRPDQIARAGVALVPQGRRLWPRLTVAEHLALVRRRSTGRRWTADSVYDLLPVLAVRRRQVAGYLSGGEQQMLALARALLTNPALVLLDEPSDGLAPAMVDQVGEVIKMMLAEGVAVVLVEQDLHLAFAVADDIAVLAKGLVVHRADTITFRRDPDTAGRLLGVTT
jgi:branched-chain amino acid transport system ATP-binding protein